MSQLGESPEITNVSPTMSGPPLAARGRQADGSELFPLVLEPSLFANE